MFNLMEVLKSSVLFTAAVAIVLSPIAKDHIRAVVDVLGPVATDLITAILVVLSLMGKDLIPDAVKNHLFSIYRDYIFPPLPAIIIEEVNGYAPDQIYESAETYLRKKVSDSSRKPRRFICRKTSMLNKPILDILMDGVFIDYFEGMRLKWKLHENKHDSNKPAINYFELSFDKRSEKVVLESYIHHLLAEKEAKLYSRDFGGCEWRSIILDHPATFEELAMDPEVKSRLKDDLDRFVRRKEWYKKVGRAWKRGYLIHGPRGTGKSTLIAAMANYLRFDIYNLDISSINSDSDLRKTLLLTPDRSIMIIEDIDCALRLEKRGEEKEDSSAKITLPGILNVIDGLWSSCGDERIIVFTTNNKKLLERLDPALFRPGRMDMHVHMSNCTMYGFKRLVSTYP